MSISITAKRATPYFFLVPSVVTILAIILLPMMLAIFFSLNEVNLLHSDEGYNFQGIRNYIKLVKDVRFRSGFLITIKYVLGTVGIEMSLALIIALLINRRFRGRSLVRTLMIVPMFICPVVVALQWRMFYDPTSGLVNYFFSILGLGNRHSFLGAIDTALFAVIIADVWVNTPFILLILIASLESMPTEIYEAAYVDGANELQSIRYVTMPLLFPALGIAATFRIIDSLKAFGLIYVMTGGGPANSTETVNLYAYTIGFQYFKIGYATTVAIAFTLIVSLISGTLLARTVNK